MNPRLIAKALRDIGNQNVPEDKHLVYVNDPEYAMLTMRSGQGEPDETTGIEHFDEGGDDGGWGGDDGSGGVSGFGDESGPGAASDDSENGGMGSGSVDGGWSGGNTYNDGLESGGIMDGTTGTGPSVSGTQGPNADADTANAEYTSIYGEAPNVGAQEINNSYANFMNEVNAAGYMGRGIGTVWDIVNGARSGLQGGPVGGILGGIYGGFTGKNGDRGESFGRGAVQESLFNGTWGNQSEADDGGNGDEPTSYSTDMGMDESGGPTNTTVTPPGMGFLTPAGGYTKASYKASSPIVAALRSGPTYGKTTLDTTPLTGIRRRYYGE